MSFNEGYALLIGVDDYSAYDATVGNPRGKSDLLGSRNDVLAFVRTCRDLDIPASNIRVLTSPRLDPSALPGLSPENIGEASEEAILAGAAWLARAIGGGCGIGLFTFSGHGDSAGASGLALCPADVTGPARERAIPFDILRWIFEQHRALAGLTCVIDACFAGAPSTGLDAAATKRRVLSLADATIVAAPIAPDAIAPDAIAPRAFAFGDRVLAAARSDQPAFQASFSGEYRGAFSWAIGAALDQWARVRDEGGTRVNLSYGELRARAERLLESLSFDQKPVLHGPPNVAELAFLQRGSTPKRTSQHPDAPRLALQVDPGMQDWRKFTITINTSPSQELAQVFVMKNTRGSFLANNEYWYVNQGALSSLGAATLAFQHTDYTGGTPSPPTYTNTQSFVEAVNLSWTSMTGDPEASNGTLYSSDDNFYLRIQTEGSSPPRVSKKTWYQVIPQSNSAVNITPIDTFSTTSSVSVGSGQTGHYVRVTP